MKLIGRTTTGAGLVEISQDDFISLLQAGRILSGLPELNIPAQVSVSTELQADPAPEKAVRAKKTTLRNPTAEKGVRFCLTCKKPIKGTAKTHHGKCKKLYAREYARNHYREKHGIKTPAPVVVTGLNPADPTLTDEQRSAARLELIKRSAEKYR
jgi:hypothetical protein